MKKHCLLLCILASVFALATGAWSAPTAVTPFQGVDFSEFAVSGPATTSMNSGFSYNTLVGSFTSQVFNISTGGYLYLYQVQNTGPAVIESFGVAPIYGLGEAGFLTGNEPAGYLADGKTPYEWPTGSGSYYVTYDPQGGPLISYGYPSFPNGQINPGEHSVALYVISPNAPTVGEAYIIDGGTANVDAWTPVPEPSSMLALLSGVVGLAGLGLRRRF